MRAGSAYKSHTLHYNRGWVIGCFLCLIIIVGTFSSSLAASRSKPKEISSELMLQVKPGDTLVGILDKANIDKADSVAALSELKNVFTISNLQIGQKVKVDFTFPGEFSDAPLRLLKLLIQLSPIEDIEVSKVSDGIFLAHHVVKPTTLKLKRITGKVSHSFYTSAIKAGMPVNILEQVIKLLSYDVDFQRDIREGQPFEALFEQQVTRKGEVGGVGALVYASLKVKGKKLQFYRFETEDGAEYFDETGQSVKKGLLRTPVDGARISSGFGRRKHPILGYTKMHKGVDFAAPSGTPIYAAGDGRVEYLGRVRGYGKYIRINHGNGYSTAYAHMSRYARGLSKRDFVRQGQVIGYVGMTGRATGPHLHYEVLIKGQQVNPLTVDILAGPELAGIHKAIFLQYKKQVDGFLR